VTTWHIVMVSGQSLCSFPCDIRRLTASSGSLPASNAFASLRSPGCGEYSYLEPVACPRTFYLVLVKPPIAVSTAWVYQQLRFELTAPPKDTTILKQCLESGDIEGLGAACFNDLEAVVVRHVPVVQDVKRALMRPGVCGVCMSGSGPTVYALCLSWDVAHEVASAVRQRGWGVWVCQPWQQATA